MRILLLLLCACLTLGCGSPSDRYPPYFAVDEVQQLELYYLDPFARYEPQRAAKYKEQFRGWPVIGKTTVTDRDTQHAIAVALTRGLEEGSPDDVASCFDPHHGLRIETANGVIEVEICFSCSQANFVGGSRPGLHPFSGSPQELLDRILTQAKVLPLETPEVESNERPTLAVALRLAAPPPPAYNHAAPAHSHPFIPGPTSNELPRLQRHPRTVGSLGHRNRLLS